MFSNPLKANEVFGYSIETDVVYGKGKVTENGNVIERDLLMDVYLPTDPSLNTKNKTQPKQKLKIEK